MKLPDLSAIEERDLVFSDAESDSDDGGAEATATGGKKQAEFDGGFSFEPEAVDHMDFAATKPEVEEYDVENEPDLGINTLKESVTSRRMHIEGAAEGENDNVVELQKKKAKKAKQQKQKQTIVVDRDEEDEADDEEEQGHAELAGDFESLNLSRALLVNVSRLGFVRPTPVQARCIPSALRGEDMRVNAVTGSGKSAAFLLPILERLLHRQQRVRISRVLILSPTRELAAQCFEVVEKLALDTGIRACLVVGGLSLDRQVAALRTRPDIIIATPGRLIDHLRNSASVHLDDIEVLVLDEADRLLELGFIDEVQELINACPRGRQTLLFSATLSEKVNQLADLSLCNPRHISVDPMFSLADNLVQEFVRVRDNSEETSCAMVLALCMRVYTKRTIVFLPSKALAHRMMLMFGLAGLKATELHGDLTQPMRLDALKQFRSGHVDFLIATDLASRGLDVADVDAVVNYSFPRSIRSYIHRVGRTARAGRSGRCVTLVTDASRAMLKTLMANAKDAVKSRKMAPAVIATFVRAVRDMQPRLAAIAKDERVERKLRLAEMNANRAANLLIHEREIMNRPKRTWFKTSAEVGEAKALRSEADAAELAELMDKAPKEKISRGGKLLPAMLSEAKLAELTPKQRKKHVLQEKEALEGALKGLSRSKRRRKLAAIQERKEALAEADQGVKTEKVITKVRAVGNAAKSKRRVTKAELDEEEQRQHKGKKSTALKPRKKYAMPGSRAEGGDSFERRYADDAKMDKKRGRNEDGTTADGEKKVKLRRRKGAFNSKNKFKRRK